MKMEYKDQMKQADREARAAVVGLVLTIIVWTVCGFGVAATGATLGSTPLWVVTGLGGTFVCAVCVTVFLSRCVFKDVGIENVEPLDAARDATATDSAGE